jgi:competence protein CoiA
MLDHFAHRADFCPDELGESEMHRRIKAEIWLSLAQAKDVSELELERRFGDVRADIAASIRGVPVAIEIQVSDLSVDRIAFRTKEYARHGVFVLWLRLWKPSLERGRYSPAPWERWLHAAYFGRVYYWVRGSKVIPYHFEPGHVHVKYRIWTDAQGREKRGGGFSKKAKILKHALRGPVLDIVTDFIGRNREWWKGSDLEVPRSKIYCDTMPRFWQN